MRGTFKQATAHDLITKGWDQEGQEQGEGSQQPETEGSKDGEATASGQQNWLLQSSAYTHVRSPLMPLSGLLNKLCCCCRLGPWSLTKRASPGSSHSGRHCRHTAAWTCSASLLLQLSREQSGLRCGMGRKVHSAALFSRHKGHALCFSCDVGQLCTWQPDASPSLVLMFQGFACTP